MDLAHILRLGGGFAGLFVGGSLLVRGAVAIAEAARIHPIVIGLTVIAFGTSAPEIGASVAASLSGHGGIAIGNVVGSNIFNVLLILGTCAVVAPLVVAHRLVILDVPIMIGLTLGVIALCADGRVSRGEGVLLLLGLLVYTALTLRLSGRVEAGTAPGPGPAPSRGRAVAVGSLLVALGLAALVLGSEWMVEGAVLVARTLGLSELIIGLTIVAAGTSLPEVVTSVIATVRGQRDIAVGNVIGSNIFNLLAVLGAGAAVVPDGLPVSTAALHFDLPVMAAVSVACLPIFFIGHRISRSEGVLLLGYYAVYMLYLVLDARSHDAAQTLGFVMAAFVIPLTAVTLLVFVVREFRARRRLRVVGFARGVLGADAGSEPGPGEGPGPLRGGERHAE
jgi:cation:H+ antiporter